MTWSESQSDSWKLAWHKNELSNREPVANFTFFINLHQTLTLNPNIKFHKKYKEKIEQDTIKFDMELKPTKT